jgi:hypothetical protein
MSSLVFTNVHIPPLLERRADLRRCALLCGVSYRLYPIIATWGTPAPDCGVGGSICN